MSQNNRKNVIELLNKIKKSRSLSKSKAYAEALEMFLLEENCKVVLNAHNGNIINCIKTIRNFFTGRGVDVGLREAKEMTDKIPYTFKLNSPEDAQTLCRELNNVNAVAFIL